MSLRLRLCLILGLAFVVIWGLAATWTFRDMRQQMMFSLDQRLVASARMVAGLLDQLPQPLDANQAQASLQARPSALQEGMACQVSSLRGQVLARSHAGDERLGGPGEGFHDQRIGDDAWRSYTLIRGDVRISTADRQLEREALNRSVWLAASVPGFAALLGALTVLWWGVGKGLAPLRGMREALRLRGPDDLLPLRLQRMPNELQPLLDTQNQLLTRVAAAIERERRLTGDAAHELRSPLTAIKTHLQVAQMTQGEAREQALHNAQAGADRLQRTLEQLLLLARVEGSLSFDDGVPCAALEVAEAAILDTGADAERIVLRQAPGLSGQALQVPAALAIAALRNLLDNALRHGPADAAVELTLSSTQGQACFSVRDFGTGLQDAEMARMTERFWRRHGSSGSGLGLAIVQAIVLRCRGALAFFAGAPGLRVELRMPLHDTDMRGNSPKSPGGALGG